MGLRQLDGDGKKDGREGEEEAFTKRIRKYRNLGHVVAELVTASTSSASHAKTRSNNSAHTLGSRSSPQVSGLGLVLPL